jgi:hypothetical protein
VSGSRFAAPLATRVANSAHRRTRLQTGRFGNHPLSLLRSLSFSPSPHLPRSSGPLRSMYLQSRCPILSIPSLSLSGFLPLRFFVRTTEATPTAESCAASRLLEGGGGLLMQSLREGTLPTPSIPLRTITLIYSYLPLSHCPCLSRSKISAGAVVQYLPLLSYRIWTSGKRSCTLVSDRDFGAYKRGGGCRRPTPNFAFPFQISSRFI